jgi:Tol biopolymer transport system component
MGHASRRAILFPLACCWLGACAPGEQLGTNLTPGSTQDARHLVWSADGSEIFFVAGNTAIVGQSSIAAVKTDGSGAVRLVDAGHDSYGQLWGPPDGSALYFTAFSYTGTSADVFEALQPRHITQIEGGVGAFVASPDDRHFAYTDGRTVMMLDTDGGSATLDADAGDWWSMVFSPSGDQLLLVSAREARTVDLAGNQVASAPLALQLNWASAAWAADGIRILSGAPNAQPFGYHVQTLATGADVSLPVNFDVQGFGWSPDARRVAVWGNECLDYGPTLDCDKFRSDLDVADAVSGAATRIAHAEKLGAEVAFSPDGARVAYVVGQSIYLSPAN